MSISKPKIEMLLFECFHEKQTTNSDNYIVVLGKLKEAVKKQRLGKWGHKILLQNGKVRSLAKSNTSTVMEELRKVLLLQTSYSLDISPRNY